MSATTCFKTIHQVDVPPSFPDSRPSSVMSCTTDSSENESHIKLSPPKYDTVNQSSGKVYSRDRSASPSRYRQNPHLFRRSSSAMRVHELREVLTTMTEAANEHSDKEIPMTGSQNARLLVASQQCLVSRLQDLRHEMESMDNEVTRVRNDIVNSRRYFSSMMGVRCGPEWPTVKQTDSAYTSPTSFMSRSVDVSPYSSDNDSLSKSSSTTAFQHLQRFERRRGSKPTSLARSDSCSSFMSWRSELEMESLFPDDQSSPQTTPRAENRHGASSRPRIRREYSGE